MNKFYQIGKVTGVQTTGYATRIVYLDDGRTFRIVKSMLAFAIDNAHYANVTHAYEINQAGIYQGHLECDGHECTQ